MGSKLPTPRGRQALIEIYQYINLYQKRFPDNKTLSEILHVAPPRASNIKEDLRKKGYLVGKHGNEKLTNKAIEYLKNSENIPGYKIVLSANIPLAGEVSAGKGNKYDDLAVYVDEQDQPNNEISIPNLDNSSDKRIVALQVRGVSMESAGILDGDFVIVELMNKNDFLGIRESQIVVTEYLPKEDEDILDPELTDPTYLPLLGYTLKVYRGVYVDENGNKVYRLGRLRDYGQKNLHEIQTHVIKPLGIVIGVYRDTRLKGKLTKIFNLK